MGFSSTTNILLFPRKWRIGEGITCYRLGLVHEFPGSLSKALNYYRLSISCYDETRRLLQSEVAWNISFRDTNWNVYTALWKALLKNGEIDEALYAADQGAQALTDNLKVQYHANEEPSSGVTTKETISCPLEYLPPQTVFIALSFWPCFIIIILFFLFNNFLHTTTYYYIH